MRFYWLLLIPFTSIAAEVSTVDTTKTGLEILVVFTDDQLSQNLEKNFNVSSCKARINYSFSLKEYFFPTNCRAHITKFLLDNGYKPDQLSRTFVK